MASIQSVFLYNPLLPLRPPHSLSTKTLGTPRNLHFTLARSTKKDVPFTEQEVLQAVAESDERVLPGVRTYENDSARLALVGAVDFEQALTAAAADGGQAADEHISSGMPAMVVETLFPGHSDPHSTVSTRLFLPARKVKEKAGKLRRSITEDMLSTATSRNILSMTFRQVVFQLLWNFELVVFRPGTERNMEDLENPREQVPPSFTLSSSDEQIMSVLAEVVCISALENTERQFLEDCVGKTKSNLVHWFRKPKRTVSKDSSVVIYKLFEDEIVDNAKSLLKNFNLTKGSFKPVKTKSKCYRWTPTALSRLEKIGGPEFSSWTSEHVPAYRLQIDANQHKDVKFEGWRKSAENWCEVLLTHSQMVGLADIIDMYYEDLYTMPDKQLSCGVVANSTNLSNKKICSQPRLQLLQTGSFLLRVLSVTLASGIFLITISALGQLGYPYPHKGRKYLREDRSFPSSEVDGALYQSVDALKLEAFCVSVVKKIKDALGWPGEIKMETDVGAWTGKVPNYLRLVVEDSSNREDMSTFSSSSEKIDEDLKASAQDIASYQVVLSTDGKIVGFQPLSSVAVNHWAANPLAKELYRGRKLSPGLTEPGLKIQRPNEVAVIELLMSVKPDACFALARPVR
ncbi:uncharacterized protein LOC110770401 isoform X1 [Prunus avium]|uniref:Uncharacterized protein LOC110770401 isoform X1 n=1 Tax=Prunus avium TaxID=42229 RepID=A0A6P5TTF0_PRUAV|nr:uncharacterized protein LOC110770401 isoform X1 [Prunus avium]